MNKLHIFAGIAFIAIVALAAITFTSLNNETSVPAVVDLSTTSFTSTDGEVSVLTTRSDGSVVYSGPGYESGVMLTSTSSASGAKYEDVETGLIVWNQGGELTVTANEAVLFVGNITELELDSEPEPLPPSTTPTQPTTPSTPPAPIASTCYVGGCSSQVCSGSPDVITTCEFREEYACYQSATCEQQTNGECGWTQTTELQVCIASANN